MADVTIRFRDNGPIVVEGPVRIVDADGNDHRVSTDKPAVALCRCGESKSRPFCDGSHKESGFESTERA